MTRYVVDANVAVRASLALAIQEKAPLVTADQRFSDRIQGHPYLAGSMTPLADFR